MLQSVNYVLRSELSDDPPFRKYLGLPYDIALCLRSGMRNWLYDSSNVRCTVCARLDPLRVFRWFYSFLATSKPGPEAIQALFALQLLVFIIFLVLGVTRLGSAMVKLVPNSLKAGIIIGAGIAAIMGEISSGGRLAAALNLSEHW
ncbi:hypothetical protein P4S64_17895 [Vibrio sp. M60_M31a]